MKRVHRNVKEASQIVFMDSSGSVDKDGSRVFILLTHTQCGGLPLGIFITSSESSALISQGFELLKEIVGDAIFYGSKEGPSIFLTDDSQSEQCAIHATWPKAKNLLCIFHVLQSVHRWLIKSSNGIPREQQQIFLKKFRAVMFAKNITECAEKFLEAQNCAINYSKYLNYLRKYWNRKELWALAYRNGLLTGKNNTNNFSESAVRLLKDKIFERVKAFNIIQLVDFILSRFSQYYSRRLLDAAHNRCPTLNKRVKPIPLNILNKIICLDDHIVAVPSETVKNLIYLVDMEVLMCSCFEGNNGKICKHVHWASYIISSNEYKMYTNNINTRKLFYVIATGQEPPNGWLQPLYSTNVKTNFNESCNFNKNIYDDESLTKTSAVEFDEMNEQVLLDDKISAQTPATQVLLEKGDKFSQKIKEICSEFTRKSPQTANAVEILFNRMADIKTPAAFESSCHTFGRGISSC